MKKVVYTCVTDGYNPRPVLRNQSGWDFICFSDHDTESAGWNIVRLHNNDIIIDNSFISGDRTKTARRVKILPHYFLSDYDLSVWIDASLQFRKDIDLNDLADDFIGTNKLLMARAHPYRRCIYKEAEVLLKQNLDSAERIDKVVKQYRAEGYPENNGLVESNFLMRRHMEPVSIEFANEWWRNVSELSRRDQLSFNYVKWKLGIETETIDEAVLPLLEVISRGRYRGPFFHRMFRYYPIRA